MKRNKPGCCAQRQGPATCAQTHASAELSPPAACAPPAQPSRLLQPQLVQGCLHRSVPSSFIQTAMAQGMSCSETERAMAGGSSAAGLGQRVNPSQQGPAFSVGLGKSPALGLG